MPRLGTPKGLFSLRTASAFKFSPIFAVMREVAFLRNNKDKWDEFEDLLEANAAGKTKPNPDKLAGLFIEVTDDLSYARTFYPESKTKGYLNQLASKVHLRIYANKREHWTRMIDFWKWDVPLAMHSSMKELLLAFCMTVIFILVGVVSTSNDESFARLVMGDGYINMTIDNIRQGDPMGVYAHSEMFDMFARIFMNNLLVMLRMFAMGLFLSFGTIAMLFFNGIMLGTFHTLLYQYGVLGVSLYTVYIHGAIEIPAMILSAAAGLAMGNSILFPRTYTRMASFQRGAVKGLKIAVGLVPFIFAAAVLESFVTRYYQTSIVLNLIIVFSTLGFMVWYFVLYPFKVYRKDLIRQAELVKKHPPAYKAVSSEQ